MKLGRLQRCWGLALLALALVLPTRTSHAQSVSAEDDDYARVGELLSAGDDAAAANALTDFAKRYPSSRHASDSLFSAAKLYEESLGDPARAIALYKEILSEYPSSRVALAAQRREKSLSAARGIDGGTKALAQWNEIRFGFSARPPEKSIALAEALIAENPKWPARSQVLLWLGDIRAQRREWNAALDAYRRAEQSAQDTNDRYDARRGAGKAAMLSGDFELAETLYQQLETHDDPARMRDRQAAFEVLHREKLRHTIYLGCFAVALLMLALLGTVLIAKVGVSGAFRALLRVPSEAIYFVPVAALLSVVSFTGHHDIGPAIVIIALGGLIFCWLLGVCLRDAAPNSRIRGWLLVGASVFGTFACIYIALHRTRLIDLVIATVRFGPDH